MSPAISPAIGGFIGHYLGWQANFIFIALFALSVLVLAFLTIPESLSVAERKPLCLSKIISTYPAILMDSRFIFYALAPCVAYIAFFAYIAQSPFLFYAQGFGEREIGLTYITLSLTYLLGGFYSRRLLKDNSLDDVLNQGFWYFRIGALVFLVGGLMHVPPILMVLQISVLTFGNGFLIPLGTAGVVSSFAGRVGYASGLLGFMQLGVAALTSTFIGMISLNQFDRLAMFIFAIVMMASYLRRQLAFNLAEKPMS